MKPIPEFSAPRGSGRAATAPRAGRGGYVLDVGLNTGQDTALYLAQGHHVVAVDADPSLVDAARTTFSEAIAAGRLELVNVGIADTEGFAEFWICDEKPEFNSFHRAIAARDGRAHHVIRVPVVRFASLLEQYGTPRFLKIDIEGHDMLCLEGLSPGSLPEYLSIESECPLDAEDANVEEGLRVLEKLVALGYRQFKLIDQYTFCSLTSPGSLHYWIDAVGRRVSSRASTAHVPGLGAASRRLMNRPRLEGKCGRALPMGSSGVWGADTPGRWIGQAEAARAYIHYREKHFRWRDAAFHSFWCDWHARTQPEAG